MAVKVPGIRQYIMLRHYPSGAQRLLFALKGKYPVHQHEGLVRQPNPDVVSVDNGKLRPQHFGYGTHRKLHAHVPVKNRFPCSLMLWQNVMH